MRLFLLPVSTRRSLLYCERAHVATSSGGKPSYLTWITNKASTTWTTWEKAPKGWKKQVTVYGNKMLDQIPYEEWGLKTIPPLSQKRRDEKLKSKAKTDVMFPALYVGDKSTLGILQKLATERQGLHRKRMIWSIIAMPFSAPFMLIPVIPNLPFFYLVFRAYSHWKALRGSQHLEFLLSNDLLKPTTSELLNQAYTAGLMHKTREESRAAPYPTQGQMETVSDLVKKQTNGGEEDVMVLQRWNGKLIAERFKLPEMEVEIERAVEQVENSIKAREELLEEKQEIEKVTKGPMNGQAKPAPNVAKKQQ